MIRRCVWLSWGIGRSRGGREGGRERGVDRGGGGRGSSEGENDRRHVCKKKRHMGQQRKVMNAHRVRVEEAEGREGGREGGRVEIWNWQGNSSTHKTNFVEGRRRGAAMQLIKQVFSVEKKASWKKS